MNAKKSKELRRIVRRMASSVIDERATRYRYMNNAAVVRGGTVRVDPMCDRGYYLKLKRVARRA